ncbi:MAG TPA: EAL domain-containing protein [Acidimicrobiales bacterium]|nr:EAL domain-containing protein [Acidimicrobiales bacterium]
MAGALVLERPAHLSNEVSKRAEAERPGLSTSRAVLASFVTVGLLVWLYFAQLSPLQPAGHSRPVLWPIVAVGTWGSLANPVTVRNRKVGVYIGLSEIWCLLGMVFLAPFWVLIAVACGHLAEQLQRRASLAKLLMNTTGYVLAVSLGLLVYDRLLGDASALHGLGLVAAAASVSFIAMAEIAIKFLAFAFAGRRWPPLPVVPYAIQLGAGIAVCTAGGLIAISLVALNTWSVALFIAIAVAAVFAYRATVTSKQRYANLEKLYDFTRRLNGLSEGRDVIGVALDQTRALLSAGRAELVARLDAPLEGLVLRCALTGDEPPSFEEGAPTSALDGIVGQRGPLIFAPTADDKELARAVKERGLREGMAAPLQRGDSKGGYLLVADRPFQHEGFGSADLRFFEALAANTGVALRSSELLQQLRSEAALREHQAYHDTLTGLPNRLMFTERLEEALTAPGEGKVAVMLMDLDGFKDVNDTLGHVTGDAVLREVAQRLLPFAKEHSLVARLGGDEFAVLLAGAQDELAVETASDQVLGVITQPFSMEGLMFDIRASMGVAIAPPYGRGRDASNLMRHADVAMYLAKESGGGIRTYDPAEDHSTLRRLTLATELRRALEAEDLDVWYQPVVDLGTGEVQSLEALLRWSHDQFGPVSPVEFIPVAESAGLIDPLTWWVLDRALGQLKEWRLLVPGLSMSVNLSARSLTTRALPEQVERAIQRAEVPPSALTLELTESCMIYDPVTSSRAMRNLGELGVHLSIDDYGTGFSSLSRLKTLPFNDLKIDRTFVKEMINDNGDEAIVRSTIELARSLGRTVTAEGVEDEATLQRLASLGCNAAQGFYLARPLPAAECESWLTTFVRWPSTVAEVAAAVEGERFPGSRVARPNWLNGSGPLKGSREEGHSRN